MWCEKCQADVAAQASLDNQRVFCNSCGTSLSLPAADHGPTPHPRDPRALLARWAQEDALDPLSPLFVPGTRSPTEAVRSTATDAAPPENREDTPRRRPVTDRALRLDRPHVVQGQSATDPPNHGASPSKSTTSESSTAGSSGAPPRPPARRTLRGARPGPFRRGQRIHSAHDLSAPHFTPAPQPVEVRHTSGRWMAWSGQIFAYLGVAVLTVGATLVLLGHFGGNPQWAPTGWLVTTAGQMLLFLGVVTLISGGMEETTKQVASKIDSLGERLVRIEEAAMAGATADGYETDEAFEDDPEYPAA